MMNTELKPVEFGTFEFSATASLDDLWKIIDEESASRAYVYLLTTEKPIRYERGFSRIVYIGMAKKTWHEGPKEFGITLARLCDPKPYRSSGCDASTWERLRKRGNRFELHILQSSPSRVKDLEKTLLQKFRCDHGRLPLLNKNDGPPEQETGGAEEVIRQFAGGD
jgi:hypothetical protein